MGLKCTQCHNQNAKEDKRGLCAGCGGGLESRVITSKPTELFDEAATSTSMSTFGVPMDLPTNFIKIDLPGAARYMPVHPSQQTPRPPAPPPQEMVK